MGKDGLGRKLAIAAAAVGAILLLLRIVGGRDSQEINEATSDDEIDRVDTGRSDEDRGGSRVETGLERVSTDDAEDGETDEAEETGAEEADAEPDAEDTEGELDEDDGDDEVPVEATRGRFDNLDLFDYVAIVGAAFEAAREEYRNRA